MNSSASESPGKTNPNNGALPLGHSRRFLGIRARLLVLFYVRWDSLGHRMLLVQRFGPPCECGTLCRFQLLRNRGVCEQDVRPASAVLFVVSRGSNSDTHPNL
jgi:hypothetical protein